MSDDERWGPPLHWFGWLRDYSGKNREERLSRYRKYLQYGEYLRPSLETEPALPQSYSRFVLPFAYAPEPLSLNSQRRGTFWQLEPPPGDDGSAAGGKAKHDGARRHQYFTTETADVLYRRARRARLMRLGDDGDAVVPAPSKTRSVGGRSEKLPPAFDVTIKPAELILFEWPLHDRAGTSGTSSARAAFGDDPLLVGMLWLQAHFPRQRSGADQSLYLKQLLWFNELYRYVREPFEGHRAQFEDIFLPDESSAGKDPYFDRWFDALLSPLRDETGRWYQLFPETWNQPSRNWSRGATVNVPHAMCHPDSRAFVATFAQVAGGAKALVPTHEFRHSDDLVHTHGWVSLLNIDNPWQIDKATAFEQRWADERTYLRWAHCGTLYGYTPHSAAAIADPCVEPPLWHHFATTYFDQTLLLLYLRTVIFRISQRINTITAQQRDGGGDKATADKFQALSRQITQFINLYQYPFLSLQQQGVEMYELQRTCMDIDALYREVREEVERTQAQLDMNRQMRLTEASHRLGVLATYGIPIAVAALFGVAWNDLNAKLLFQAMSGDFINGLCTCEGTRCIEWVTAVTGLLLAVVTYLTVSEWVKSKIGKP